MVSKAIVHPEDHALTASGESADAVSVVRALVCELHHCALQLAAKGRPGRAGDSVSRALANGRAFITANPDIEAELQSAVGASQQP